MINNRRVVITGMATINPLGDNLEDYYSNLISGKSGIKKWSSLDMSNVECKIGGDLGGYDYKSALEKLGPELPPDLFKKIRKIFRNATFSNKINVLCTLQAYLAAGLLEIKSDPFRTSILVGGHNFNSRYITKNAEQFQTEPLYIEPLFGVEALDPNIAATVSEILGLKGPIWRNHFKKQEPQNAAVGRFKKGSDEIFIWCRSRYSEHQKPFVFNSKGKMIFDYIMDDIAPAGWTASGVEVIHAIDWTGQKQQLACAKERHESGDVCLFEPLTGKFVKVFTEYTDRLYVADVTGDWREEIIVLNKSQLHIYENKAKNPRPNEPRKWKDRNYRRLKQCHNYYSP